MPAHSMLRPRLLLLALLVVAAALGVPARAAQRPLPPEPFAPNDGAADGPRFWEGEDGATIYAGEHRATLPGPNALARLIVVLRTPPVVAHQLAGRSAGAQAQRVAQVQAAVRASLLSRGLAREVRRPLGYLVNALPITARLADRAAIAAIPEVAAIFPDYELHAAEGDDGAIARIGAPALWAKGATGQGTTVAVVDTGIDYTHPDLGGCLGSSCKVRGGYDFVNDDADPSDDNGHGTHVAGIVAANGATKGVAPDARLLAYKVLNSLGNGATSTIIAGLERAADPDNNPATDDAPDAINMSIGGPGSPDDPLAQAVSRVVAQGIVVVVAAGNDGAEGYGTIGSPGAAADAITVGASDAADAPASFTSLGPVGAGLIKPDLVAPGSQIRSTVPSFVDASGYARLSGTSMASPHVAGLVALLRQRHPRWRPAHVKAALVGSAQPLGLSPYAVGGGRARGDVADTAPVLAQPAALSFGLVDDAAATWSASATLTLSNTTGSERTYQLAVTGLPNGASVQIASSVTLKKGEAKTLPVKLTVDTAALPAPNAAPYAYDGAITVTGGGATGRVPLAFMRAAQLHLDLGDEWPDGIYIHDRGVRGVDALRTFNFADLTLPPGTYDLLAVYGQNRVVLKQGIALRGRTTVALRSADASVTLRTALVRRDGQRSQTNALGAAWMLLHSESRYGLILRVGGTGAAQPLRLSPAPGYTYESHQLASFGDTRYDLAYHASDITADRELTLDASGFTPVHLRYAAPPGAERVIPVHGALSSSGKLYLPIGLPLAASFEETIWRAPQPGGWFMPLRATSVYSTSLFQPSDLLYRAPALDAGDGATFGAYDAEGNALYRTSDELPVGFGPVVWEGRFANTATSVLLGGTMLADQWGGSYPTSQVHYALDGATHREGTLDELATASCGGANTCRAIASISGPQRLALSYRALVEGHDGWADASVTAEFDLDRADHDPPAIRSFALETATPRSTAAGDAATLRLRIADDTALASVHVFADSGNGWQEQTVRAEGDAFSVAFANLPALAPVNLKIVAEDTSGNRLTNELRPAFIGGLPTASLVAPARVAESTGGVTVTVQLSRAAPQPVTVSYATRPLEATSGGDYAAISGKLVFAPGETSKQLFIAIRDDTLPERDEAFALALSSPERALLASPSEAVIVIADDDNTHGDPVPTSTPSPTPKPGPAPAEFRVWLPLVRG